MWRYLRTKHNNNKRETARHTGTATSNNKAKKNYVLIRQLASHYREPNETAGVVAFVDSVCLPMDSIVP